MKPVTGFSTYHVPLTTAPQTDSAPSPPVLQDGHAGTVETTPARPPVSTKPTTSAPVRDPQQAVAFCDAFNAGERLAPSGLDEKLALMCSSPLKLARCMPALMMSDILGAFADLAKLSDKPAPVIWIDGDCHQGNFGIVQSRHGHAVWGLNDFDMACQGSPAMDLDRLAFSLVASMRERGLSTADTTRVVDALAKSYHKEVKEIADGQDHGEAYLNAKQSSGHIQKLIENADAVTREDWIKKYAARGSDGSWHLVYSDKVEAVDPQTSNAVSDALHAYDHGQGVTPSVARPLQIMGVAQKLQSGGSSHGQPRYFALVENVDAKQPPILLEVKQELPAPLVRWNGDNAAAVTSSRANWTGNLHKADAAQVVRGQLSMGGDQNPLSGATSIDGISYLVREREPCKATLSEKSFATVEDYASFADQAGQVLGLAHGRSAEQANAIVSWMGDKDSFAQRLDTFAQAYANQAEADVEAFRAAHPIASGSTGNAAPDSAD